MAAIATTSSAAQKARPNMEKFTFTVGKLDAGMAILLGPNAHLIEFPSLLLPPNLTTGSIVTITVSRDHAAEQRSQSAFTTLQTSILAQFGQSSPKPPVLKLRNVTQTSVTVEWDQLELAQASVRSLEIYKNGVRLANVWKGRGKPGYGVDVRDREWKGSSLQSGEEYTFQLVLKTTAGTYSSNLVRVRTQAMNDTSGILVCFGTVQPSSLLADAKAALESMGARSTPTVQIDTTHFVCTTPSPAVEGAAGRGGLGSGATKEYERAIALSLPIVQPSWVFACAGEKKLMPISNYTLSSASSSTTASQAPPFRRAPSPLQLKKSSLPFTSSAPNSPGGAGDEIRRSPSPETIGRMAMHIPGANQPSAPERRDSIPVPAMESPVRPRSPRAEADGRLDRGFKFPVSTPPTQSPTTAQPPAGPSVDSARAAVEMVKQETKESVILPGAVVVNGPEPEPRAEDAPTPVAKDEPLVAEQASAIEEPVKESAVKEQDPTIEEAQATITSVSSAEESAVPAAAQEDEIVPPAAESAPSEPTVTEQYEAADNVPEVTSESRPSEDAQGPTEVQEPAPSASEPVAEEAVASEVHEEFNAPTNALIEEPEAGLPAASTPTIEVTPTESEPASGAVSEAGDAPEPKLSKNAKKKAKAKAKKQEAESTAMEEVDLS